MMIRGVTAGRPPLDDVLVVDIGGGSTELVLAEDGEVAFATSLDVGCVRLTERFLGSDPPSRPELAAAGAYVRSLLPQLEARERDRRRRHGDDARDARPRRRRVRPRADAWPSHPARVGRGAARAARGDDADERVAVPGSSPAARPSSSPGIVVLREVMTAYGLDGDRGVGARHPPRRRTRGRRAARARGGRGAARAHTRAAEAALPAVAARRPRPARPRRAAAAGRCARGRRRGGGGRPRPGTRSASSASRKRNASSSGTSGPIVKCGASAIARSSVVVGSRPGATTSRTSVFRVTTPTSRSSSVT